MIRKFTVFLPKYSVRSKIDAESARALLIVVEKNVNNCSCSSFLGIGVYVP